MADIDNLKGGTKRVVEESTPLNNLRGGTKRVVIVDGGGGSSLPDQTGQSGKFLTTDGTDASWSDKPLVNKATGTKSLTILGSANSKSNCVNVGFNSIASNDGVAIGFGAGNSTSTKGVAIGTGAITATSNGYEVAIGMYAAARANRAIQIGYGTNSDANTFKVANANGNFEIMSADGTVPTARLTKVNTTATLAVADWSSNTQTVSVTGITANGVVLVSPTPANQSAYTSAGILCTSQAAGSLTFTCDTVPSADITVTVVML